MCIRDSSKAPPPIERRREPDLTAFDGAADADALVAHILDAARPLAERVLILTARGAGYAARAAPVSYTHLTLPTSDLG